MLSPDPRLPQQSGSEAAQEFVQTAFWRRFQERFYALWRELSQNDSALQALVAPLRRITIDSSGNLEVNGSLKLNGASRTFQADMTSTPFGNRFAIQTSTTDGATGLHIIPNGTATYSDLVCWGGSARANTSWGGLSHDVPSGVTKIVSAKVGTGTALPLVLTVNSGDRVRVETDGAVKMPDVYADTVGGTNRDLYIDDTGLLGYVTSIRASKTNIADITDVSWLYQLNPVSYQYRKKVDGNYTDETDGPVDFGLIAEDTEPVKPELCFYDEVEGEQELRGINYSKLIVPMLKALQEQQSQIAALQAEVQALRA